MEFSQLIKNRYSCKKYDSNKAVPQEKINALLEAAQSAPTAKNLQEQKIYVIQSKEMLSKVDEATPCRYGAPVVICVAFNKKNVFTYPGNKRDSGIEDASIVATHIMLATYNEGLNSCWLNLFDPDVLKEKLGLPEDEEILMLLDVGYASEDGKPLANHTNRKDLSQTVKFI